jgi:hypothetical protein
VNNLIFDIETDGMLDDATRIHCIAMQVHGKKSIDVYRNNHAENNIEEGLKRLQQAPCVAGHNILEYDLPVLKKIYPWFKLERKILDTLIAARLLYPDIKERDAIAMRKGHIPRFIYGKHSLEAWGHRLDLHKGKFDGPWDKWSKEMEKYCIRDVRITDALLTIFSL